MQKYTSRQIQAQKTKRKIYKAAISLFNKQGFDNTTIADISRKAGVSVGAFYHYYSSKSDIYSELFKKIDEFFQNTVEAELVSENSFDNIILFFKHYAAYNLARGTDAVKQLFNTENPQFLDQSRYMMKLLKKLILTGQEKGQITTEMNEEEIMDFLLIAARGVVYDWLLHDGDYDMSQKMEEYFARLFKCLRT